MLAESHVWEARPFCWRGFGHQAVLQDGLADGMDTCTNPISCTFILPVGGPSNFNPNTFYLNLDLVENRCSLYKKAFKSAQC